MSNQVRLFLGLALVFMGLFWGDIKDFIPNIGPSPSPNLVIDKPNDDVLERVSPLGDLVTGEEDRLRLAVFNNVFSERCTDYNADAQQVNDIYVEAAKNVFGDSLKGKYEGYGQGLNELLKSSLGTENHEVTLQEKQKLSQDFKGLAYSLAN